MCLRQALQASKGEESTFFGVIKKVFVGGYCDFNWNKMYSGILLSEKNKVF